MSVVYTLDEPLSSFNAARQDSFKVNLAAQLFGVSPSDISLRISAGSINVEATIRTSSAAASGSLATAIAAQTPASVSAALGETVISINGLQQAVSIIPAPSPPPPPPPIDVLPDLAQTTDAAQTVGGADQGPATGLIIFIVALVLAVAIAFAVYHYKKKNSSRLSVRRASAPSPASKKPRNWWTTESPADKQRLSKYESAVMASAIAQESSSSSVTPSGVTPVLGDVSPDTPVTDEVALEAIDGVLDRLEAGPAQAGKARKNLQTSFDGEAAGEAGVEEVEDLPKRGTPGWHPSRMVRARKANADQRKTIAKQPAEPNNEPSAGSSEE